MVRHPALGSIPAHTGDPVTGATAAWMTWVYPRAYGGSCPQIERATHDRGLSPRIRGIRYRFPSMKTRRGLSPRIRGIPRPRNDPSAGRGSIPAHTGDPRTRGKSVFPAWVYPRAYGGSSGPQQSEIYGLYYSKSKNSPALPTSCPAASRARPLQGGGIPAPDIAEDETFIGVPLPAQFYFIRC